MTDENDQKPECNWTRCHRSPNPCFAWCKCRCHVVRRETKQDPLRDLLGHSNDEGLIKVIASAISDAQVHGRVEYKRRVGPTGRQTMAETVLWRLREHLSNPPAEETR